MTTTQTPLIYWLRRDLRLADNPALFSALQTGQPIIPVYIYDETPTLRPIGAASRWWLHQSLESLAKDMAALGAKLLLRRGVAADVLDTLLDETKASAIYWSRSTVPEESLRDASLKTALSERGVQVKSFNASLLIEPWTLTTKTGGMFQVFTPYWAACCERLAATPPEVVPTPSDLAPWQGLEDLPSDDLAAWQLLPSNPNWAAGWESLWPVGEQGALDQLGKFVSHLIDDYANKRDLPAEPATSKLSPHLHWGEIGPRQIWRTVQALGLTGQGAERFLTELGWREFCHYQLFHNPHMREQPLNPRFDAFEWQENPEALAMWQQGKTGIPLVDAGMRELWQTGWMHNRVRMVVASFLVKDLLIDWREGERWFWDTLVDADSANNIAGWQWVAGCGADAAPFFRIFNPITQAERFDPDQTYIRHYVPEVETSRYPAPLVDRKMAHARAMEAFGLIRNKTPERHLIHASCVAFKGRAVLIMGDSGAGKSDLALRLLALGGELVADDQVEVSLKGNTLEATSPAPIKNLIEARHTGILKVKTISKARVVYVVYPAESGEDLPRLPEPASQKIAGVTLPMLKLPYLHDSTSAKLALLLQGKAEIMS